MTKNFYAARTGWHELKIIRTEYDGISYRSKTEARWAVLLDLLKVPYTYEKEGYYLHDGHTTYCPDFWIIDGSIENAPDRFFVEVKGEKAPGMASMQRDFVGYGAEKKGLDRHAYLVSDIPHGRTYADWIEKFCAFYNAARRDTGEKILYDSSLINGGAGHYLSYLYLKQDGKPALNSNYNITPPEIDIPATLAAYNVAAGAKFDHEYRPLAYLGAMRDRWKAEKSDIERRITDDR